MSTIVNIRLDDDTRKRIDRLASSTDRTRSYLVKIAIDDYLETNEWQVQAIKEAIDQADTPDAEFIQHGKVDAWLASWGQEDETERPR